MDDSRDSKARPGQGCEVRLRRTPQSDSGSVTSAAQACRRSRAILRDALTGQPAASFS